MKKLFILLIACISLSIQGYAQAPDVLPQVFSPNAAELGKYGKVPVSYFNGLPNISIPLTELKAKDYTLPIYLTYHAGGNKPDQHPGWVGQGWTLHAGGCINRIIRGKKDEMTRAEIDYHYEGEPGYLYNAEKYQSEGWLMNNTLHPSYYDYEPDEFQVNLDEISASFYFTGDGEIKIVSRTDADFTIKYEMNDNAPRSSEENFARMLNYKIKDKGVKVYNSFQRFILTSRDGTKYYFGGDEDAIEYSITSPLYDYRLNSGESDWDFTATANTWMLTKIERTNGEVISFQYSRSGIQIVEVDSHFAEHAIVDGEGKPRIDTFSDKKNH